jgi:hypothetical protein
MLLMLPLLPLLLHDNCVPPPAACLDALCNQPVDGDQCHAQQQASNERNPDLQQQDTITVTPVMRTWKHLCLTARCRPRITAGRRKHASLLLHVDARCCNF